MLEALKDVRYRVLPLYLHTCVQGPCTHVCTHIHTITHVCPCTPLVGGKGSDMCRQAVFRDGDTVSFLSFLKTQKNEGVWVGEGSCHGEYPRGISANCALGGGRRPSPMGLRGGSGRGETTS